MGFARGLTSQLEVVHALALRETRTRFGQHQMGYLWALVEPALTVLTFVILFLFVNRRPEGMDLWGFVTTGMVPYTLFTMAMNRVADSINANKALLFYPHVQPLDVVIARSLLEFATYVGVFIVMMGGSVLYQQELHIHDLLMVVNGMLLAGLLGSAMGLVFCGLGQISNVADRARGPLLRPLFWISGLFFTSEQCPDAFRDQLLLNPVLHVVEMTRAGWYSTYEGSNVDAVYVLGWILGFAVVGLIIERSIRTRIELT